MERKKPWRKVLYEDQNVPDNYVDESFLVEMKKNIHVRKYKYWDVVLNTTALSNQICIVVTNILIWWLLADNAIAPNFLFFIVILIASMAYLIYLSLKNIFKSKSVIFLLLNDGKTALVGLLITEFLSPVLKTLTHTISTDTVYTMTLFMALGHLLFNHYGGSSEMIMSAISLNMAVFSTVCLASRLQGDSYVFVYIITALLLFGLWPRFYTVFKIKMLNAKGEFFVCFIFTILTSMGGSIIISIPIGLLLLTCIIITTFICPMILISLQPQKDNIHGPWDEAVISTQLKRKLSDAF